MRLDQYEFDRLGQLQDQLRDNPLAAERVRRETAALIPDRRKTRKAFKNHSNRISVHRAQNTSRR